MFVSFLSSQNAARQAKISLHLPVPQPVGTLVSHLLAPFRLLYSTFHTRGIRGDGKCPTMETQPFTFRVIAESIREGARGGLHVRVVPFQPECSKAGENLSASSCSSTCLAALADSCSRAKARTPTAMTTSLSRGQIP
jgi:hypothetical protein